MFEMQDDTLTGTLSSMDVATKENLENLVKVGEKFLKKPVSVKMAELKESLRREMKNAEKAE